MRIRALLLTSILALTILPTVPASASVVYEAVQSGAWDDPATWGGSVPQRGPDHVAVRIPSAIGVTIPPGVSVSPFNWDIFIDGFLFNGGSLEISGSPTLGGRLAIAPGAELWNHGVLRFEDLNTASSNYGKIVNNSSGLMELQGMNAGTLRNDGDLVLPVRAMFVNYGVFENRATVAVNRIVARPDIPPGTLKNQGGTVINTSAGMFSLGGRIENVGSSSDPALIENRGTIDVLSEAGGGLGVLANIGDARSVIDNYGLIQNGYEVSNPAGVIRARCSSSIIGNAVSGTAPQDWCDSVAPSMNIPVFVNAEATGPDGAHVPFTATATDDKDPSPSISCTPAAGSLFPLGTTTVTCTATDYVGNPSLGEFDVNVLDTTPPAITLLEGTTTFIVQHNSYVDAGATANDLVDGDVTSSIDVTNPVDPAVLGTYSVEYRVSDAAGNEALETREVEVITAAEAIDRLIAHVEGLSIPQTSKDELLRLLTRSSVMLHDSQPNNDQGACRLLDAFVGTVRRQQNDGVLTQAQADYLVTSANEIKIGIGCR